MRTYAREQDIIWMKQFPRILSHDEDWENKTCKLVSPIIVIINHQQRENELRDFK